MTMLPQIAALSIVPALSGKGARLLIGLKLENGRIHWSNCPVIADVQALLSHIQPFFTDQPLASFPEIIAQLDDFREEVTVTYIIPSDESASASSSTISRRKLISGFLAEDEPKEKQVQVVEKRPLPTPLRFAISQVLFQAAAAESNQSLLSLLRQHDGLAGSSNKIPLFVDANESNMEIVRSILSTQVASLGYSTGSTNHKATLGANCERLQAHVRQVKSWIASAVPEAKPAIHLNIQGGFTDLYDNDEGKILGALYGLEQAAKPYPLVMENMIVGEETPALSAAEVAVSRTLRKVQSYLGVRKMSVKLAAGNDLFSTEALRHFVERKSVHQIHLDMARFGSIPQIIAFIETCHAQNRKVIVKCDEGGVKTAVSIALATQSHALSGPPHLIYNEMIKTLSA